MNRMWINRFCRIEDRYLVIFRTAPKEHKIIPSTMRWNKQLYVDVETFYNKRKVKMISIRVKIDPNWTLNYMRELSSTMKDDFSRWLNK